MRGIRAFAASVFAVALALMVCFLVVLPIPPGAARALVPKPGPGERFFQVVAHPDDDLLFMSPDLFGAVVAGRPTVTVYLTAGEGQSGLDDNHDPQAYAQDREAGVREAYAFLAGVRDDWTSSPVDAGNVRLRVDTLVQRPDIHLIFAGLPDGGDPRAEGGRGALGRLWAHTECVTRFTVRGACLTGGSVLRMLRALYSRFRPTVLRTLDPSPPDAGADHVDHVASARFALAAAPPALEVRSYRGYTISDLPPNLAPPIRALKRQVFQIYRRHDYRAFMGWHYRAWLERMYRCRKPKPAGYDPQP